MTEWGGRSLNGSLRSLGDALVSLLEPSFTPARLVVGQKPMRTWLRSIRDEHVAFTGTAWMGREELRGIVKRQGGKPTPHSSVTGDTTVLVRGYSSTWAFGKFGTKEQHAARLIRGGASISLVLDSEFRKLVENGRPARVADRIAGDPVQWLAPTTERQFKLAALKDGPLDREQNVLGRVEQSYLRRLLFGEADDATCSVCRRRLPVGLLVAAHIKPRSVCSRSERLDCDKIVFSLCLLGCDALYERGLVGVGEKGRLLISTIHSSREIKAVLRPFKGRKCEAWNPATAKYFRWHEKWRFQGAKA